jgi:flagellar hook protein FlgE
MSIPSIFSAGVQGINNGLNNLQKDAQAIASSSSSREENTADIAESLVDLNINERNTEASVKVVQAADEVLGALLDIKV